MFDYDVVIIGGGAAGLTAGLYLSRARRRVLLFEKDAFGGHLKNAEWIENYSGFPCGVPGPRLAEEMFKQATQSGLQSEIATVTSIELFSNCRCVTCADGQAYTAAVVIITGGSFPKKLGVRGEEALQGKGVFECALCDGGRFADRVVAVCGSGESAVTEALYMTKLASRVFLLSKHPALRVTGVLRERAVTNPKLEIRYGVCVKSIIGNSRVEGIQFTQANTNHSETLSVDGVLVRIGNSPNTSYLEGIVPLNERGEIIVDEHMQTPTPYILAAGDIRSGSARQLATAVGDGATAAIRAERLLEELG